MLRTEQYVREFKSKVVWRPLTEEFLGDLLKIIPSDHRLHSQVAGTLAAFKAGELEGPAPAAAA